MEHKENKCLYEHLKHKINNKTNVITIKLYFLNKHLLNICNNDLNY